MNIKKIQAISIDRDGIEIGGFYMKKFVMVSGVDPNTNLDSIDEEIIRITGKEVAKAYAFYLKEGGLVKEIIEKKYEFDDIKQLMNFN